MVDGQRIHRVIGRESEGVTRTQAEEFVERARTEAREKRLSFPQGRKLHLTFAAAADLYLSKLKEVGGRDYVNNEQHLRLHLKPYFGSMRLDQISTFTLQKFQAHCRSREIADSTINRILATYRRMGRKLVRWKVIPAGFPMIELQKEHNVRDYVISAQEEKELLDAAVADGQPYIWLFVKLGLATSLRHSEMLSARFQDFDPERRRLRVRVKGGRWRRQPLPRSITDILVKEREMALIRWVGFFRALAPTAVTSKAWTWHSHVASRQRAWILRSWFLTSCAIPPSRAWQPQAPISKPSRNSPATKAWQWCSAMPMRRIMSSMALLIGSRAERSSNCRRRKPSRNPDAAAQELHMAAGTVFA